jgi:hypothetical protein
MVVSNMAAIPSIIDIRDDKLYCATLVMSMSTSIIFHANVGSTVSTIGGWTMHTGLEGTHNQYSSDIWLLSDQIFAFLAMAYTLHRFGPIWSWPRSCQLHAQFAISVMLIGEMVTLQPTHVVAHTMWHIAAYSLPSHLEDKRSSHMFNLNMFPK